MIVYYSYLVIKCPKCGDAFEVRMFSVCSGLGPEFVVCSKCKGLVETGRYEWLEMSFGQKVFFLVITSIYIGILGLIGGICLGSAYSLWQGTANSNSHLWDLWTTDSFKACAIASGVGVIVIQTYRIVRSIFRSRSGVVMHSSNFIFGLQMNMQIKCLLAVVMVWMLAEVIWGK